MSNNSNKAMPELFTTNELAEYLHCGRKFAIKIGKQAQALVPFSPKKHLWDKKKIEEYINAMREETDGRQ